MSAALESMFDRRDIGVARSALPAGASLFAAGDPATHLYIVRAGLMAVFDATRSDDPRLTALIRRGETVGEMALLAGTSRTRSAVALRDCIIDSIAGDALLAAGRTEPGVMIELAGLVARRASGLHAPSALPRTVLIAGLAPDCDAFALAHGLAVRCDGLGYRAVALDSAALGLDIGGIAVAEETHDIVFVSAAAEEAEWSAACRSHVDRLLLLGRAAAPPPPDCALCTTEPLQANGLVDLVLERRAGASVVPSGDWITATAPARVHHIGTDGAGIDRLARALTGTAIGLALSGGGARAFAHVGAVRALREAGVPIDAVAGTSMGAIVAAGVASGWDDKDLDCRMRDAFVTSSPLDDIAFPIVAMTRGRKVETRLQRHFGAALIEDLAIPFLCGSTNLTTGRYDAYTDGPVVDALRASISLPGILPPVVRDGCVLVDGGLLRNLPTAMLRESHAGTVIGCDVTRAIGLLPAEVLPPRSWIAWFASGMWRRGPPLVSILMCSATISTHAEIAAARAAADLYVMPELDMIEIRDWKSYPRAVEAGYRAMSIALAGLEHPVTHLRAIREARRPARA